MRFKTIAGAILAIAIATPATSAPVAVDVTFGSYKASIYGLDDSITTYQTASSFELVTPSDTYSCCTNSLTPNLILLDATGGISISIGHHPVNTQGMAKGAAGWLLAFFNMTYTSSMALYSLVEQTPTGPAITITNNTTTATASVRQLTTVPLPAGGVLLVTALAGAAALNRRRKNTI
ncbi:hypothetical protein IWQ49_006746 [Labrenzia sp. EL_126]|nr:hypothetical protein [Labrenzia sp. EL_126]